MWASALLEAGGGGRGHLASDILLKEASLRGYAPDAVGGGRAEKDAGVVKRPFQESPRGVGPPSECCGGVGRGRGSAPRGRGGGIGTECPGGPGAGGPGGPGARGLGTGGPGTERTRVLGTGAGGPGAGGPGARGRGGGGGGALDFREGGLQGGAGGCLRAMAWRTEVGD